MNEERKQADADPSIEAKRLVDEGLRLYGQGEERAAIDCWRRALQLVPGERRALDFLEAAGAATEVGVPAPAEASEERRVAQRPEQDWRARVVALVRARRHEEALEVLYEARRHHPDSREIRASIQRIKEYLVQHYARMLGGMDRVFHPDEARRPADLDDHVVLRLVDGVATVEDIVASSPLGRLKTLQVLASLFGTVTGRMRAIEAEQLVSADEVPLPEEEEAEDSPDGEAFDRLFEEATRAYLARRYDEAERLFARCLQIRPEHAGARLNLRRLQRRRRRPQQ